MKVLVAEDEYCSRMNLIRQIKECLFHTTLEIFEAENGREAWDIFLGQHPELVLTDIRMPLLDGLELTEMISQSQLHTKVIIVSGFAEFEYAQRAMKYGAVGYLLKPIQEKELMNLLRQKEIIGGSSGLEHGNEIMPVTGTSVAVRLKQLLTSTGEEFGREGDNILNEIFSSCYEILIWMNTEDSSASLADSVKNSIMQRIRRQNDALCKAIELNHDLWVILTSYGTKKEVSEFVGRLLEGNSQQIDICIGISSIGHGVRNLQEYHKQAIYALSGRILYPGKKVLYFDELNNRMNYKNIWNPPKLEKLKTYLIAGEGEKAFSFIRISIQELLRIKDISIYSVIDALKMVEIVLNEAIFHIYQNSSNENVESPVLFSTHFELIHYSAEDGLMEDIKEKISKMCSLASLVGEKDAENTVQMVIDYIRLNYNNDITLKDLAENVFFLNGSYLSHLLKIKTGKNYLTYLTEIRMEKAEELVRESEMTVTEIAGLCGYNDISKFIQVFKKYYGKTPKRYREDADTKDTI